MKIKSFFLYILVSLFLVFEMGVQVSPSIMSLQLKSAFGVGYIGLGVMSSIYFYSYTIMQIPAGIFFDNFKLNKVTFYSLTLCSIGAILFSQSSSVYLASIARFITGLGSAFAFISVLVLSKDLFNKKSFSLLAGTTQMLAATGAMGGCYPLEVIVNRFGWRNSMLLLGVVGLILACLILKFADYDNQSNKQNKHKAEMSHLFKNIKILLSSKLTWLIAGYACFLWAPMSAFASLWGVEFLQAAYHIDHKVASFILTFMWIGIAVGSPIVGLVSELLNRRKIVLALCAILGAMSFSLLLLAKFSNPVIIMCLVFLSGFACSGQALSFAVVRDCHSNNKSIGAAIGFNNMAVVISGAIFQPLVGFLIEVSPKANQYQIGLSIIGVAYLLGFLIAVFSIPETLQTHSEKQFLKNLVLMRTKL